MTKEEIQALIEQKESKLTGDMFSDMDLQEEIHGLKRMVKAYDEPGPERPNESYYECEGCGS